MFALGPVYLIEIDIVYSEAAQACVYFASNTLRAQVAARRAGFVCHPSAFGEYQYLIAP